MFIRDRMRAVCLAMAALLALTVCTGAGLAYCQPEAAAVAGSAGPLYCHGHGGHGGHGRGGRGHHGSAETCDWLFHACGDCADVYCDDEDHIHRCPVDCDDEDHLHYGVCLYADGTMTLVKAK